MYTMLQKIIIGVGLANFAVVVMAAVYLIASTPSPGGIVPLVPRSDVGNENLSGADVLPTPALDGSDAVTEALEQQDTSTDHVAIEQDLEATDLDTLDVDLDAISQELTNEGF